jgi:uncharacterized cupin superfamily protein
MSNENYILSAIDIANMTGINKVHFNNPNAKRLNRSLGDATGITGFGVHMIEVQPGDFTSEHHLHYHEDECVYVVSGNGTVFIGDEAYLIEAGDFIAHPKATEAHSIQNTGNVPLICLVVGERLTHDVCDYPRLNKRMFRNKDMPWMMTDIDNISILGGTIGKK